MSEINVKIYGSKDTLPKMEWESFFHSPELFHITCRTPKQTALMAVAFDGERVVGHLLAIIRRRTICLPPFFVSSGRVFGEGEYADDVDRTEVFQAMLTAITKRFRRRLCFVVEFSNISQKMFGYRCFRQNGYFPINWQEIHNSLHSMPPEERLSEKTRRRIRNVYAAGVETREAATKEEVHDFYMVIHGFYKMKVSHVIPAENQFLELDKSDNAKIFVTIYKGKIIGGCVCAFSNGSAYLWYLASKRKTYAKLHPNLMTVWQAIRYSYDHNYAHFYFMNAGLPWSKSPFRDFVLSFGGKPVAKYRWFRFSFSWLNRFLTWLYRE